MRIQKDLFSCVFKRRNDCFAVNIFVSHTHKIPFSIYKHPTQRYPFLCHCSQMLLLSCHDWPHLAQIIAVRF